MNSQQQPRWQKIAALVSLLTTSYFVSLFGLFCLSFPFWKPSFILAPYNYVIGGVSFSGLDTGCIFAVSYVAPILICLICLAIVALDVMAFRRGRGRYLLFSVVLGFFLLFFFMCSPIWEYLFIWGDGWIGTGCEVFMDQWFPTGALPSFALLVLNLVTIAFLTHTKQNT